MDKSSERGGALVLILGILAITAVAAGGWMLIQKGQQENVSTTPASNLVPSQQPAKEERAETAPEQNTDAAQPAPDAETEFAAPVKIDVNKAMSVRAIGEPNAPIKIIEFASLTCSHCAHFHNDILPEMKAKYIDTGKVYLEFREFPLNDPAMKATLTARCLPPEQYENFVDLLFRTQESWANGIDYVTALKQNAKLAGMSEETFDACQAEPQLKIKLAEAMQKGKEKWNIAATPTFIINDGAEVISGAQPLQEFERAFRKVSNDEIGAPPAVE